jgi:hypothetical protein
MMTKDLKLLWKTGKRRDISDVDTKRIFK